MFVLKGLERTLLACSNLEQLKLKSSKIIYIDFIIIFSLDLSAAVSTHYRNGRNSAGGFGSNESSAISAERVGLEKQAKKATATYIEYIGYILSISDIRGQADPRSSVISDSETRRSFWWEDLKCEELEAAGNTGLVAQWIWYYARMILVSAWRYSCFFAAKREWEIRTTNGGRLPLEVLIGW